MRINSKIVILVAALSMLSIPVWGQKMDVPQFSKAEIDSTSYLVGVNFGAFILNYDFPGLDYSLISKGMNDFAAAKGEVSDPGFGKQFRYNPDLINDVFNRILEKQKSIKANSYKLEAQEFLQKNRYASGVMSTYSGLQYKIISKGSTKHPTEKSVV